MEARTCKQIHVTSDFYDGGIRYVCVKTDSKKFTYWCAPLTFLLSHICKNLQSCAFIPQCELCDPDKREKTWWSTGPVCCSAIAAWNLAFMERNCWRVLKYIFDWQSAPIGSTIIYSPKMFCLTLVMFLIHYNLPTHMFLKLTFSVLDFIKIMALR